MNDMISREWVLKNMLFDVDREVVRKAPAVGSVPVVRCKDCKDYRNGICGKIEYIMDGYYHGTYEEKRPDDFCSYGEKKKSGKENIFSI